MGADKRMVPTVYEETDMCKDGKAGGVGGKGFPCPDACYFQNGQSTNGRYTFGKDVNNDHGLTRKSVCNRENVCICLVETCQNNPTGHMIVHMSQCTATRVGEECTPTCYGPATGDYVNYRGAHAMGNFVNHEPTGPATCESTGWTSPVDKWSGVYCVCADVSDADFSELMVTAGKKPEPEPGAPKLEQPSIPSSCTEAAALCAAEDEATKKMMTDYCPVTCETCPPRPPRVTTKGCACAPTWTLDGYDTITDYCGNPDDDELGDWCFLTPDGELSEGTDPNSATRGHGYCEEEAK